MKYLLSFLALIALVGCSAPRTGETMGDGIVIEPFSVDFDSAGNLYGVEWLKSNRVFKIDTGGNLSFIAGVQAQRKNNDGDQGAMDGKDPMKANFTGMHDLAVGPDGSIYLADTFNFRVRKIDKATGEISTIAGTGVNGFSGDGGPANKAQVATVHSLSFNPDFSKLYMVDLGNQRIRIYHMADKTISTFAGTGEAKAPEDGAIAVNAPLLDPRAVIVDKKNNVYILSRRGHSLLVVNPEGTIRTVANAAGKKGYSGDGGDALTAAMNGPKHLATDDENRILITDTENHVIRRYDPVSGNMELVAGIPEKAGSAFSTSPFETELARPHGSRVHDGWIYISDSENNRLLRFPYP
jgi:hypothetical protein